MHAYLLGFAHGVLHRLLHRTLQAELGQGQEADAPVEIALDLGVLFQLGFDAGLIKMTSAAADV
ncbi:hypothetical protein ACIBH1_46950 [Nonomuraea sp. NPDC050663]|uniref:hypothetical protein n=1 Tax=Nonomuraea sp. NPDC050663 TaxID=3364370 RepID=UPI0037B75BB2